MATITGLRPCYFCGDSHQQHELTRRVAPKDRLAGNPVTRMTCDACINEQEADVLNLANRIVHEASAAMTATQ